MRLYSTALAAAPSLVSRRALLLGTAAVPLTLGACGGQFAQKVDVTIQGMVEYGQAIYAGLKSMWAQLQTLPQVQALSAETRATITTSGKAVGDLLSALGAVQGVAEAQPIVAKLVTYAQAALGALGSIPGLPGSVAGLISAAQIVLPVLQSLVGIGIATVEQVQAANRAKAELLAAPAG
jgi:hypothetical protein